MECVGGEVLKKSGAIRLESRCGFNGAYEPAAYIQHVLEHIAEAETVEALEQLLPWNVSVEKS
jgi:hypothetical protein